MKTENKYFLGGADITLAEKCKITLTDVSKLSDRRIVVKVSVQDFNFSVMSVNSSHTAQNMPEYKFYLTGLFPMQRQNLRLCPNTRTRGSEKTHLL